MQTVRLERPPVSSPHLTSNNTNKKIFERKGRREREERREGYVDKKIVVSLE